MFNDLLYIPFDKMKCWALVREVQRRLGNDVPDYEAPDVQTAAIHGLYNEALSSGCWEKLSAPVYGSVIAFALDPEYHTLVQHFGVCLGERFIHTLKKANVLLTPMEQPYYKSKMRGFYSWTKF